MRNKVFALNSKATLVLVFAVCLGPIRAKGEESIKSLRDALVALAPDVDPHEADLLSVTAHTTSRRLAREYGVTWDPAIHNFLINIGVKKRGICADYTRDIGACLKEFHFKTLVLHWGAAYAKQADENNGLVVTARNQPFLDGIVLDGWRKAGRLFWCPVKKDREYEVGRRNLLGQLGGHPHSGITAWREDLQESALLQEDRPSPAESNRKQ